MNKELIIITGASSGIGQECAKLFADKGYQTVLLARRVKLIEDMNLPNSEARELDVTDFEKFKSIVDESIAKYGPVKLLINCAGIMPIEWFSKQSHQDKMDMIDINLKGVINGMDAVLNHMLEQKGGTILNVSSTAGRWTADWRATYNATKFGVHAVSEGVRKEIAGSDVRVLLFAPAIVDTNLLDRSKGSDVYDTYVQNKKSVDGGLTAKESAEMIYWMFSLPPHISVKELVVSHTNQKV